MKFETLSIEKFLTIGSAEVKLANRGLVLIQGVNDDDGSAKSNGAGKSSIMDALCWCLYGETARGVSGDDVINNKAGKGTRVSVEIHDTDGVYVIARHRKHKTGKNSLTLHFTRAGDGETVDLTKGTDKLTQVEVDRLIGSSYEVFKSAVYAGQEQMPDLPGMTDKFLKELIEEAAGSTILAEAHKEALTRLGAAKAQLATDQNRADLLDGALNLHRENLENAKKHVATWEEERNLEVIALRASASTHVARVKELRETIDAGRKPEAIRDDIKVIDAKIAGVQKEKEDLQYLSKLATDASVQASRLGHAADTLRRNIDASKKAVETISSRVGQPCGECGKAYCAEDLHDAKEIAKTKLRGLVDDFKSESARLDDAQKRAQTLADDVERFRASMTDVSAEVAQRASLQRELDDALALVRRIETETEAAKAAVEATKAKMAAANPFLKQVEELTARIAKAEKDHTIAVAQIHKQAALVARAQVVVKVFSPAGVRAHILDEVTPFLNDRTAAYLGSLSDGNISATWSTLVPTAKGELKEKFSIEVENETGGKSFKGISGGEKRKVRIATALALQDLVARRATKPIELFIGDEIDDALDDAGRERLTSILEEKARERGSVFIISHSDLRDWIPQVMTVRKKDGESSIVESVA